MEWHISSCWCGIISQSLLEKSIISISVLVFQCPLSIGTLSSSSSFIFIFFRFNSFSCLLLSFPSFSWLVLRFSCFSTSCISSPPNGCREDSTIEFLSFQQKRKETNSRRRKKMKVNYSQEAVNWVEGYDRVVIVLQFCLLLWLSCSPRIDQAQQKISTSTLCQFNWCHDWRIECWQVLAFKSVRDEWLHASLIILDSALSCHLLRPLGTPFCHRSLILCVCSAPYLSCAKKGDSGQSGDEWNESGTAE